MKDLTKGPIFKTILMFAIPIFFGNLFQLFYSLTDTRIVGTYLGDAALAAVGGSTVLCLVYLWKKYPLLHFKRKDLKPEAGILKELLLSGCSMAFGALENKKCVYAPKQDENCQENVGTGHDVKKSVYVPRGKKFTPAMVS